MTKRIFGVACVRNEADRYLDSVLAWNSRSLDAVFVYDDASTDDTVEIALRHTPHVVVGEKPLFMDNESEARAAAWALFVEEFKPTEDDWVVAFDGDEFLVGAEHTELRTQLEWMAGAAEDLRRSRFEVPIVEIWSLDAVRLLARTDGTWGSIRGIRFGRFSPEDTWKNVKLGGGSLPVSREKTISHLTYLRILHFGYADPRDRWDKHNRYTKSRGKHSSHHIESIIADPTLTEWEGVVPQVWRGVR